MKAGAPVPDEGDKGFWIALADLMSALMVLFLVVMTASLVSLMKAPRIHPQAMSVHEPADQASAVAAQGRPWALQPPLSESVAAKEALLLELQRAADSTADVTLDPRRLVIDFGEGARFPTGSHQLDDSAARRLREFTPRLLDIVRTELGRHWVRRVVVEGFADPRGDYLYNLNLSLQRAQRVLCVLLGDEPAGNPLDAAQRQEVRRIFAVGGFATNDPRSSLEASRRIELRIEFGPPPADAPAPAQSAPMGQCRLRD
jgi:outer membrane protein OmpA-like peptidoglycan-associated protein